ncbi:MAG: hypothetical protein M0Z28_18965 [Rhodospirillales bacterium]|nr:hypothetical protein [Rhodospirillales bacterium]
MSAAASRAAGIPTHLKTRHPGHGAGHAAHDRPGSRPAEKSWRKSVDRGLEIIICIGHIVGAAMLVADHLF